MLANNGRENVYIECPNGEIALRTSRYLFSIMTDTNDFTIKDDNYRFHDCELDPYQMENLNRNTDEQTRQVREDFRARTLDFHINSYRHVPKYPLEEMV